MYQIAYEQAFGNQSHVPPGPCFHWDDRLPEGPFPVGALEPLRTWVPLWKAAPACAQPLSPRQLRLDWGF